MSANGLTKSMIMTMLNMTDENQVKNERTLKVTYEFLRRALVLTDGTDDRMFYREQIEDALADLDEHQMKLVLTFANNLK